MGMTPASSVGSHFVLRDQSQIDKLASGLLSGPADTFTVNTVIATNGARVPDSAAAQKTFRMATIYVTLDRLATADEMAYFDHATTLMDGIFARATMNAGHLNTTIKDIAAYAAVSKPEIHWVGQASGGFAISRNGWIEIKGAGLAPASVGGGVVWSSAPEFAENRMPTSLSGVSVRINGKPAYVYFVSLDQINVLAPLDNNTGTVNVEVTNGSQTSDPFPVLKNAASLSFFYFGATSYIAATHANGSLLGPTYLSAPGYPFTPAKPGETIVLYGSGFGATLGTLTEGSATQSGTLPSAPAFTIGGKTASVAFAGVVAPGLYQFNVVVPALTPGEAAVQARVGTLQTIGLIAIE